jgi:hypothetical protein
MCGKWFYLVSIVVVLSVAGNASADLILHWGFDEGTGNTVYDLSGNGHDGTIEGGATWAAGKIGGAIELDGTDDYVIDEMAGDYINDLDAITICLWIKSDIVGTDKGFIIFEDPTGGDNRNLRYDAASWAWEGGTNIIKLALDSTGGHQAHEGSDNTQTTDWQHVTMVWSSGNELMLYIDGRFDVPRGTDAGVEGAISGVTKLIVGKGCKDADGGWDGLIDDVRIYSEALTEAEIQIVMKGDGYPYAVGPDPADGELIDDTWTNLGWTPGDFAVSHNVYIGDDFDAVSEGAEGTFVRSQADTFIVVGFPGFPFPDGLVPGATYYWRIDEVNDTEPNSPWKGPVWSFRVPPKTAYLPDPVDGADSVDVDVKLSWTGGFGSKVHTVYFGETFEEVDNATGGQAQGTTEFNPGALQMAKTYYWRVDEFDIVGTHKGDVWSFTTEGAVSNPNPANGAVGITQTPVLTWTPGVFADTHEIYFGADAASLENKGSGNLGSESFEPGLLEWNTTYYWRIDEANNANADSPWIGPLWSFTTANFLIIDDMEAYNDLDPAEEGSNRIFNAWIDGYDDPTNGSLVGYDIPPFAEQTIVNSGNQSMPMYYDNSAGKSEATLTLTSNRDWTINGLDTLTIWFRGDSANAAETLYVTLNGSARVDNDNPDAATITRWTPWNIELHKFADRGVNLSNVNSITLGLGSVTGGTGIMYFDDIRLYAPEQ